MENIESFNDSQLNSLLILARTNYDLCKQNYDLVVKHYMDDIAGTLKEKVAEAWKEFVEVRRESNIRKIVKNAYRMGYDAGYENDIQLYSDAASVTDMQLRHIFYAAFEDGEIRRREDSAD